MSTKFSYTSELFQNFRAIKGDDVYSYIRFYEHHLSELNYLSYEERFIVLCYYCNALYAAGSWHQHLHFAQKVLETSISEGIQYVDNYDVYLHTLHQKMMSHWHLKDFVQAENIGKQLLALAPNNKLFQKSYGKIMMAKRPEWIQISLAIAVSALAIWTSLSIMRIMFLDSFFPSSQLFVNSVQWGLLSVVLIWGIIAWLGQYYHVGLQIKKTLKSKDQ